MVADAMPQQLRKHRRRSGLAGAATLVAWCLAGALDGPLAAQNREHQQMAAELRILQEQQQLLAQTLAQVIEALKAIPTRIDDATAAMRKGFADQELRISALTNDVSSIRERTQDSDTRLRSLRDEVDALRATLTALQTQITQLAQAPAPSLDPLDLSSTAPPPSNAPPTPSAAPIATTGLSPSRMLDSAKSDYFASQFTLALSGFEAILRTFPRTESASEAQFYIGETYSSQQRWNDAIAAYTLVVQNYPSSGNVPEAYYKRGRAYENLGQADAARASWELVIKTYPESTAATLAKQGLDRLSRKTAP
jgi:tol-pal system protein YbgF